MAKLGTVQPKFVLTSLYLVEQKRKYSSAQSSWGRKLMLSLPVTKEKLLPSSAKPKPQLKLSFSFIHSFSPPPPPTPPGKVFKAPVKQKFKPQLVKLSLILSSAKLKPLSMS